MLQRFRLFILSILCCMFFSNVIHAQESVMDSIKVFGNCNMCKANIEGALKKKEGVLSKNWDKETKMLAVTYNPAKITVEQIGQKVAGAGYDNQYATASNSAYFNLHSCCQYERPQKSTEEKKSD